MIEAGGLKRGRAFAIKAGAGINAATNRWLWIHQDYRQVSSKERTNVKNGGLTQHWIDG
jgi:hypothetical protein